MTLNELSQLFLTNGLKKHSSKTVVWYSRHFDDLLPHCGDVEIEDLKRLHLVVNTDRKT